jgi:hypothetical protein
VDVTRHAGIDFVHSIGDEHISNLVQSSGGASRSSITIETAVSASAMPAGRGEALEQ